MIDWERFEGDFRYFFKMTLLYMYNIHPVCAMCKHKCKKPFLPWRGKPKDFCERFEPGKLYGKLRDIPLEE